MDNNDIPKIEPEKTFYNNQSFGNNDKDSILIPQIKPHNDVKSAGMSNKRAKFSPRNKKIAVAFFAVFSFIVGIALLLAGLLFNVYKKGLLLKENVSALQASIQTQDLEKVKAELNKTKLQLTSFKSTYNSVVWMGSFPYIGSFIADGGHAINAALYGIDASEIVINAVEPYADIIGFTSGAKQAQSGDETTQDRIDFIVKTVPNLIPSADELTKKIALIDNELSNIDPQRYPQKFKGIEVRGKLVELLDLFSSGSMMVKNSKPLLEAVPYLIGSEGERTYLVLFQNDKELRPTGGFITAYTIAKVKDGKFNPVISSDIYNLDNKYKPTISAPSAFPQLLKGIYIGNNRFRLRDLNWIPDFGKSMETFVTEAQKAGIDDIDGIIAVDTQLLVNLLNVIGPIGVPGYGNFSTEIVPECKCPQVIYELESFADQEGAIVWSENEPGKIVFAPPNYDNRKKIIGPLMNSILSNTLGQPKEKLPKLAEAAMKSVMEKHVLVYILDEEKQKAVRDFGIGGAIVDYSGDYLHINDANLGGRKSNLYVTQDVVQDIRVSRDGSVEKTLTITYKNPEKHDGWLNSVLPNYFRVYVPKGSSLEKIEGAETTDQPGEDLGKTVFSGSFNLRPQGVAKVVIKYKLPFKIKTDYKLLIQKQPGKDNPRYTINIGRTSQELFLTTDKELKLKI